LADLLVDTDVFVDHLRGHRPLAADGDHVRYSAITRAELFAGRSAQEDPVRLLLAPFTEIDVDRSIAESGGRLRRTHAIALPDALIAATALRHELTLVTRNVSDFGSVPGLSVRAPE
jgi:predicted nucleic acid-binding protein